MMKIVIGAALAALQLIATGCGGDHNSSASDGPSTSPLESTGSECKPRNWVTFEVTPDSLIMKAHGAGMVNDALKVVPCIVDALDGPASLPDRVNNTSGLDGQQTEEWDGYEASWSYMQGTGLFFAIDAK